MRRRFLYIVPCIIGTVVPMMAFVPWVMQHGADLSQFFTDMFANRIAAFFALDVIAAAVVVMAFAAIERVRGAISALWPVVVATLCVGVSLSLLRLLWLRELRTTERSRDSVDQQHPQQVNPPVRLDKHPIKAPDRQSRDDD